MLTLLIGFISVLVAGFLIALQLIKCHYCPHKNICRDKLKNGHDAPCNEEINNNNNNAGYAI